MAKTAIQGDKTKNKVAKLCYAVRGSYHILRNTSHGSYFVKKLHKSYSRELKFMAYDFHPFPLSLKPYKPIDTTDTRYLKQSHTPLTDPLKKALYIELYNEKRFTKSFLTSIPPFTYQRDTLKIPTVSFPSFPSLNSIKKITLVLPSHCSRKWIIFFESSLPPLVLHKSHATTYYLFFVQYIPEDTIKPR